MQKKGKNEIARGSACVPVLCMTLLMVTVLAVWKLCWENEAENSENRSLTSQTFFIRLVL